MKAPEQLIYANKKVKHVLPGSRGLVEWGLGVRWHKQCINM
jgi:hypothetical protein